MVASNGGVPWTFHAIMMVLFAIAALNVPSVEGFISRGSRPLGASCQTHTDCLDVNAVCSSRSKTCMCKNTYFDNNGKSTPGGRCLPKRNIGQLCPQPDACKPDNSFCDRGTCACKNGYYPNGPYCSKQVDLGEACTKTAACEDANALCLGGTCACRRGYMADRQRCVPDSGNMKPLGAACMNTVECAGPNAVCGGLPRTCKCDSDFYDNNGAIPAGMCERKVNLGESCPRPDACAADDSVCDSGTCECAIGYYPDGIECRAEKPLGANCKCNNECGRPDSVCDHYTNKCVCLDTYYDSNGAATPGGMCAIKVSLGGSCPQPDACAADNSVCEYMTCVCDSEFYVDGMTCSPLLSIGETCALAGDCKGSDVACEGMPLTCRCPSSRYLDVATGNCLMKLALGASCEAGQCGTADSFCDTTSNVCVCADGFFDDNGATAAGTCTAQLALGAACTQTDSCADANAECSTTCVCVTGYYNNAGTCEPLLCIGETCVATSDCSGTNVECSGSPSTCRCPSDRYLDVTTGNCVTKLDLGASCEAGQCGATDSFCDTTSNVCVCADGFFDDNGATAAGTCTAQLALGAACTQTDSCSDPNAECSTNCVCITGYYNDGGICEPLRCIGENCTMASDCRSADAECAGWPTTCMCPATRYLDDTTGDCLTKLVLGDSCEAGQCGTADSYCDPVTSACICADGFFDDNGATSGGTCTAKLALAAACTQTDSCADANAECSTNCVCITGYYNNAGTCEPLLCIGQTCAATSDCSGTNVECSASTCRCPSTRYLDVTTGNCVTKLDLGASCEAGQCGATDSFCDTSSNVCVCADGFFDDNGATAAGTCTAQLALAVACTQTDSCADPNAECSTTCVCVTGYYNNAGTCEPLLCIGETCVATSDCSGTNVECSGSPLTCRCPSDRYLDITTGNCLTKIDNGVACEAGQCTGTNAYCNPLTLLCDCATGTTWDGTDCLQCPGTDWEVYAGSCYYFGALDNVARYDPSRTFCDTFDDATTGDSNLVQIDTSGELTFVKDFITARTFQPVRGYWNDLYEATTNGNEVWRTSGDALTVSDWNPGQPVDNGGQVQKCTLFVTDFSFRQGDFPCDTGQAAPLCEATPGTTPQTAPNIV